MSTKQGLKFFEVALASDKAQLPAVAGEAGKIRKALKLERKEESPRVSLKKSLATDSSEEEVQNQTLSILADILKVEKRDIDPDESFENYGMDSIMMVDFLREINEKWRIDVPVADLMERSDIASISGYLFQNYFQTGKAFLSADTEKKSRDGEEKNISAGNRIERFQRSWKKDLTPTEKYFNSLSLVQNFDYQRGLKRVSDESELEVFSFGNGEPILFLAPFGMTFTVWLKQIEAWSSERRLIFINLPGHGLSKAEARLSPAQAARHISEALSQLEIEGSLDLVGASFGGVVAQQLAAMFPEKFKSLILANIGLKNSKLNFRDNVEMINFFSKTIEADFQGLNKGASHSEYDNDYQMVIQSNNTNISLLSFIEQGGGSLKAPDEIADKITTPTLVIYSDQDGIIDKEDSKSLSEKIKNAVRHEIKGAGHFSFVTHSEEFNDAAMKFIQKNSG